MSIRHLIRTLGLALVAVMAVAAFGAVAAQASPNWIVPCHKVIAANKGLGAYEDSACTKLGGTKEFSKILLAGETRAIRSAQFTSFSLKTPKSTITCTGEKNTGELIGGQPGTDTASVEFTGCSVTAGTGNGCTASTSSTKKGVIGPVLVYTGLGFREGAKGSTTEALDLYAVDGTGNTFATFKLEEKFGCSLAGTVTVRATGEEIGTVKGTAVNKKCGIAAQVGKIEGGAFKLAKSGETAVEGALNFPGGAELITKTEIEEGATFKTKKCTLETEILGSPETSEEIGVTKVEASLLASPFEPIAFGWEV